MLAEMVSYIYSISQIMAALILLVLICLYMFQDRMIYQPNPAVINLPTPDLNPDGYKHPQERGIPYENVSIRTSDDFVIHCWLMKAQNFSKAPTIIYFHGNAGNIGFRLDIYETIYRACQVNILAVSYRGYGYSTGKPSEQGLLLDADAVIAHAFTMNIDTDKIFLFGASLGGAVSIYAATKFPKIRGVIVENTFTSMPDLVDHLMPKIAIFKALILRNYWPSLDRIKGIKCNILFIAGLKDELIPHSHMLKLYNAVAEEFRDILYVPEGDHNMSWKAAGAQFTEKLKIFITETLSRP